MKHKSKKIKFKKGRDATRSSIKKLLNNFLREGKIETSLKKIKFLKSIVDRLTLKAQIVNNSNRNVLLKYFGERSAVEKMFNLIGPEFKTRKSGFVKIIKTRIRVGDGTALARLEWIRPIIEVKETKSLPKGDKPEKVKLKVEEKSRGKSNKIDKTSKRKRS